jgi:hypothetical protein
MKGTMIFRNVGKSLLNDTASHPGIVGNHQQYCCENLKFHYILRWKKHVGMKSRIRPVGQNESMNVAVARWRVDENNASDMDDNIYLPVL